MFLESHLNSNSNSSKTVTSISVASRDVGQKDSSGEDVDNDALASNGIEFNSMLALAVSFAKNNKVHHHPELKCFTVMDNKSIPFQVILLPTAKCSCDHFRNNPRADCVHIMAVKYTNGENITERYKVPKLSSLVRGKSNGKLSGRKRKGLVICF